MKIAIVGSRGFNNYSFLDEVITNELSPSEIDLIISGGARGADSLAERFAADYGFPLKVYKAEWDKYGKRAGYLRNVDIVSNADIVFAFWDGKSKGTLHSINLAKNLGKKLIVKVYDK